MESSDTFVCIVLIYLTNDCNDVKMRVIASQIPATRIFIVSRVQYNHTHQSSPISIPSVRGQWVSNEETFTCHDSATKPVSKEMNE